MAGRPRQFDRGEALLRARDLFWTRGYEGVSMADLVAALGLASARIYAAFGSKAELFREAVELYEREEGGFAERALAEELTARAALERIFNEAIDLYTRRGRPPGCMVVTAAANCATENAAIGEWLADRRQRRAASFRSRIEKGMADGDLPPDIDARVLGDYLAALFHGISVQARDGVSRSRLRTIVEPALRILQDVKPRR